MKAGKSKGIVGKHKQCKLRKYLVPLKRGWGGAGHTVVVRGADILGAFFLKTTNPSSMAQLRRICKCPTRNFPFQGAFSYRDSGDLQ